MSSFNLICLHYIVFLLFASSCSRKHSDTLPTKLGESNGGSRPPAYVQKAWDARYSYDPDRRLLVPEYAGSRWGAVQQYKEEGKLEYQDWWVRDVRSEDLVANPDTSITSFLDEDGNLTTFYKANEEDSNRSDESSLEDPGFESVNNSATDDLSPFPSGEKDSPFEPSPFSPFSD
jgi:hypothetical protein